MRKKLIIFGTSNIAECAYEYFTLDSQYEVVAFTVDKEYIAKEIEKFCGKPLVPFESLSEIYNPNDHAIFIALGSQKLNRLRTKKVNEAKKKGYTLASYISSKAFIWPNVQLGEHVFIQENNTLQPFVKIGNNVTLWAGNHIGHSSVIEDNCFLSSHVVLSGHCLVGENTFIGVNATIAHSIKVGRDNFIGMAVVISSNTQDESVFSANKSDLSKVSAKRFCSIKDD